MFKPRYLENYCKLLMQPGKKITTYEFRFYLCFLAAASYRDHMFGIICSVILWVETSLPHCEQNVQGPLCAGLRIAPPWMLSCSSVLQNLLLGVVDHILLSSSPDSNSLSLGWTWKFACLMCWFRVKTWRTLVLVHVLAQAFLFPELWLR